MVAKQNTSTLPSAKTKADMYIWSGTNRKGEKISGEQESTSVTLLKADLRRQGITVKKIKKKPKSLIPKRIKNTEITAFSRQMATMLVAGIPLIQSLDLISKGHANPEMQKMVQGLKSSIENGSSIQEALETYPKHFNSLYRNLIGAGERSGSLDIMFDRVASYKEKTDSLLGKIKKAMYYPAAIVLVALVVSAILLVFVVPQFQTLFANFGATLPAPTRFVIALSKFMQAYWWLILIVIVGAIWGLIYSIKHVPKAEELFDRILLRAPVLGGIIRKATIARFARTLSTTFAAGLPLVDALNAVGGATGNLVYANATQKIKEDIASGQTLQMSVRHTNLFPNMIVQMIAIGEESGTLEGMLSKVADIYEQDVDNAVDSLSSLLEPFIMVVLGGLIGGLVIAMYMPIFKLGSVV